MLIFGAVRSGRCPAFKNRPSHRGRASTDGAYFTIVLRSMPSGSSGLPQSRLWLYDQSSVKMTAFAPAERALSICALTQSRPLIQYIWKRKFSFSAAMSSIGFEPNDESPIAVPRAAAARATASSPSGCTACTPVGEIITGIERSRPSTDVAR